jgi:hypothetical protein
MKVIATPSFNEKVDSLSAISKKEVAAAISQMESNASSELDLPLVPVSSENGVFVFRAGRLRIFLSIGENSGEKYILLVDLAFPTETPFVEGVRGRHNIPNGSDPRKNMVVDPNRNMTIDPRRNMMIDPRRNMMIDPNRNMMIDPRRNMMINPRRNMMVDPNRNVMIDPRRNSMINPQKNSLLDPRRNSVWDGAFIFNQHCNPQGYFIRASEKVALQFDMSSQFDGFCVLADKNINGFDLTGRWTSFFVENGSGGYNQFDVSGQWMGFTTKRILSNNPAA